MATEEIKRVRLFVLMLVLPLLLPQALRQRVGHRFYTRQATAPEPPTCNLAEASRQAAARSEAHRWHAYQRCGTRSFGPGLNVNNSVLGSQIHFYIKRLVVLLIESLHLQIQQLDDNRIHNLHPPNPTDRSITRP